MKRKYIAQSLLAGVALFFVCAAAQSERPKQHDVVTVTGYGAVVWWSSSSSNAPKFPDYEQGETNRMQFAEVVAQALDQGFEQKHVQVTEYGTWHVMLVRVR